MTADNYSLLRRLTPRVVAHLLHMRARRAWVVIVGAWDGQPLLGWFTRRFLLTRKVVLKDVAGDSIHRVSELVLEETPPPEFFSPDKHGSAVEATRRYLRSDPFQLGKYPDAGQFAIFKGGVTNVQKPVPGILYVPPQRYHCTLGDAYVNLEYGGICTARGTLVVDCMAPTRHGSRLKRALLYGRRRPRPPTRLAGHYTTIWGKWAAVNYYHWLIDCLPRLERLQKMEGPLPTLLLPERMPDVWEDALACCLPAGMTVKRGVGWVQPERFIFSSFSRVQPVAFLDKTERDFVCQAVMDRFGLRWGESPKRRIYISRRTALTRRLINEDEVVDMLSGFGIEPVHPERLGFEEQVRLFHGADLVIGPHGAGFANLLFARGAKVLELFAQGRFKPLYFFLARSTGQEYRFLSGSEPNRLGDFCIDTVELREVVEDMLRKHESPQ